MALYEIYGRNRNINPSTVIIAATLLILCCFALSSRVKRLHADNNWEDWDVLIFTQHWPNTVCLEWEEKGKQNTCAFPRNKGSWSVHGIWPTKLGTVGPQFCNPSMHFNPTQLDPIKDRLVDKWVDVENVSHQYAFWKHEWKKHGTCAAILPPLSTEVLYFSQGLNWLEQYNMADTLSKAGILPDDKQGYAVTDVWNGVKQVLGKNPSVQCVHDSKTGQFYLFEIRICFNKSLELTDCDGIKGSRPNHNEYGFWLSSVNTNCPLSKPVLYPTSLPMPKRSWTLPDSDSIIISLYKVVQFLQWLT